MSTTTTHKAYTQSATSILTTELNALANNANSVASSAVDNTTNLDLFMDLELKLVAQTARTGSPIVIVYMAQSLDGGTTYADVNELCCPAIATFSLDAATTARVLVLPDIPIPPGLFKLFARNQTSQAFGGTLNTLRYRTHSLQAA